jgi:hypothetical protein
MKNKANYTTTRNYRDFVYVEEEETPIKRPLLLKKKKSFWQRLLQIFKK